jgi:hypothetical protein
LLQFLTISDNFLTRLRNVFYICCCAVVLMVKVECPVPSEPLRLLPLAADRSKRGASGQGHGQEETIVGFLELNCGDSATDIAGRQGADGKVG